MKKNKFKKKLFPIQFNDKLLYISISKLEKKGLKSPVDENGIAVSTLFVLKLFFQS